MLDFGLDSLTKEKKEQDKKILEEEKVLGQKEKNVQGPLDAFPVGFESEEKSGKKDIIFDEYDQTEKLVNRKDKAQAEQDQLALVNGVKPVMGDVMLPTNPEAEYESQEINNCYACTAAAMINQHMKNKVPPSGVRVNQYDVRAYAPKFDHAAYLKLHTGTSISKERYDKEAESIEKYCGINKQEPGNIFALSDLFLQLDPTVSVNLLGLDFDQAEVEEYKKKKEYFIKTVKEAISKGEAVGFLNNGKKHYVTIIGIVGDNVKYLDSSKPEYKKVQSSPIDEFLPQGAVELTWFSNEDRDDKKLADKYGELYISDEDHKLHSNNVFTSNDHGRLLGLTSQFTNEEKEKEGADSSISNKALRVVYVPGVEDIPQLDLPQHREVYHAQKNVAPVEKSSGFKSKAAKLVSKKKEEKEDKNEISFKSRAVQNGPVTVQIPTTLELKRYVRDFSILPKGKSEAYLQFADALENAKPVIEQISEGQYTHDEENYGRFLELYMAAERYYQEHRNSSKTDEKQRCEVAYWILYSLDYVTNEVTRTQKLDKKAKDIEASPREENFAKENIGRFTGAYFEYCKRVDQELITTADDKLVKKWNAIKTIERDILIHFKNGTKFSDNQEENQLLYEYTKLRQQMKIRNLLVKKEEKKENFSNEGLKPNQLEAISRVDTWVIRNIRNGGWFKYLGGLSISDRTDIATKLLAMPKRQRLYAYYLVETNERAQITEHGAARSQIDYIPDVDAFKKRMIPHRAKFYLRFSGSYIYWHKLTQAMAIATGAAPLIKTAEKYFGLNEDGTEKVLDPKPAPDMDKMNPEEKRKEHIRLMMVNAKQAIALIRFKEELNKEPDKNKDEIKKVDAQLVKLSREGQVHLLAISDILNELEQHQGTIERSITRADVTQGIGDPIGKVTSIMLLAQPSSWNSLFRWKVTQLVDYTSEVSTLTAVYSGGISALSIIGGILGSVLTLMNLYDSAESMTSVEKAAQIGSVGSAGGYLVKDIANIVALSTSTSSSVHKYATYASSAYATLTMAAVDTTVAIVKGASLARDSYHRRNAARLAAEKTTPNKYREGMLKLNEKLSSRQRISTIGSGVTAAVTLTGSALIVGGVASLGLSLIPGIIALGIGVGLKVVDSRYSRKMRLALFDSYFEVDRVVEQEKEKYKKRYPKRALTHEQEERIRVQVRGRIAAQKGFYSPGHAAKAISAQFADYLLNNIVCNNSDAEMSKAMIQGLGLKYKEDPDNPDNTIPTRSDIIKKLCG